MTAPQWTCPTNGACPAAGNCGTCVLLIAPSVDQCRSSSHGADGWRCDHRDSHSGGHRNGDVTW